MMNIGEGSLEILSECTVDPLSKAMGCCHYINNIQAKTVILYIPVETQISFCGMPPSRFCVSISCNGTTLSNYLSSKDALPFFPPKLSLTAESPGCVRVLSP